MTIFDWLINFYVFWWTNKRWRCYILRAHWYHEVVCVCVCVCVWLERFHCLAVWNEEDFHFIVFGSPTSPSSRYVLVGNADVSVTCSLTRYYCDSFMDCFQRTSMSVAVPSVTFEMWNGYKTFSSSSTAVFNLITFLVESVLLLI